MSKKVIFVAIAVYFTLSSAFGMTGRGLTEMSLEELMNVEVMSTSKKPATRRMIPDNILKRIERILKLLRGPGKTSQEQTR